MIDYRTIDQKFAKHSFKLVTSSSTVESLIKDQLEFPQLQVSFRHISLRVPTPYLAAKPIVEGLSKSDVA